jgi:aldose 1-epimerase
MKTSIVLTAVITLLLIAPLASCTEKKQESSTMDKKPFGKTPDGTEVFLYTLQNKNGMQAVISNYGGTVVSLFVPDRNG